jgi:hypothetical protein
VVVRRVLPRVQPRHDFQGWRNGNGITTSWYLQAASTGRCLTSGAVFLSCVDFRPLDYELCPLFCCSRQVEDRHPEARPTTNWRILQVGHGIQSCIISGISESARLTIHLRTHSHSQREGAADSGTRRTRRRQLLNLLFLALPSSKIDLAVRDTPREARESV